MNVRLNLQRVMLAGIFAASIYFGFQNLRTAMAIGSLTNDPVTQWELRFQAVKKILPFKRGVVGYISDSSIPGVSYDPNNDQGEYVLTQYVMSPIIIVKGTGQEWNIGNLRPEAYKVWSQSNHGQFEVIPFKGNIYLIHKLTP